MVLTYGPVSLPTTLDILKFLGTIPYATCGCQSWCSLSYSPICPSASTMSLRLADGKTFLCYLFSWNGPQWSFTPFRLAHGSIVPILPCVRRTDLCFSA